MAPSHRVFTLRLKELRLACVRDSVIILSMRASPVQRIVGNILRKCIRNGQSDIILNYYWSEEIGEKIIELVIFKTSEISKCSYNIQVSHQNTEISVMWYQVNRGHSYTRSVYYHTNQKKLMVNPGKSLIYLSVQSDSSRLKKYSVLYRKTFVTSIVQSCVV